MTRQIKDLKAQILEFTAAKTSAQEELTQEKQSRAAEAAELRRQLNDLTQNSESETRQKNEKIKRLQEENDTLHQSNNDHATQQRAEDNSRDKAELESLRAKIEKDRTKLANHE